MLSRLELEPSSCLGEIPVFIAVVKAVEVSVVSRGDGGGGGGLALSCVCLALYSVSVYKILVG